MLAHNAEDYRQAESRADARWLRGEKWVEDACLNGRRNSRPIVADFEEHPFLGDAGGLDANRAAAALFLDGVPRVSYKVHEHLLELPGIAPHERKHRIEVELNVNVFRGGIEVQKFEGARDDLIECDTPALRA